MIQALYYYILLFFVGNSCVTHASFDPQDIFQDNASQIESAQHQMVDSLLSSAYHQNKESYIVIDHEWQELDCDQLIHKIDRTQTIFGPWGLRVLAHPIADLSEIERRQSRVKVMVDNPLVRLELARIFKIIKEHQDELLVYWDPQDDLNRQANDLYYHMFAGIDKHLNRNRIALEASSLLYVAASIIQMIKIFGLNGMSNELILATSEKRPFSVLQGIKNGITLPFTTNWPYPGVFKNGYDQSLDLRAAFLGNMGDQYVFLNQKYGCSKILSGALAGMYVGMTNFVFLYMAKQQVTALKTLFDITHKLQVRMTNIARLCNAIEQLRTLLIEHEDVFGHDITDYLNLMNISPKVQQLVKLLKTPTFGKPAGLLYYRGQVLLAHQLLTDAKDELIPPLQQIGFVDAYCSVAQLYNDQSPQAPWCFAQYIESTSPYVQLEHFWTPLMPTSTPVLNDIAWNEKTRNKIILTGPSGSGKSTVMKSVAHCVLLAQSFGIAPAQKATLKLFTGLRSSLNPREDLQHSLSTFMAEKLRIDQTRDFIKNYTHDDCFLVLLDEPYRGTVEVESNYRVCQLGKELAGMNHCMLIIATHLQGPIDLEQQTGVFSNYQLRLDYESGKFIRTFELIPGAALWWFEDVDKRRMFVDQLLDNN